MSKTVNRGYVPGDEREFFGEAVCRLRQAGSDLYELMNRGYPVKGASAFVGNHYLLSERQRLALVRAVFPESSIRNRKQKEITGALTGRTVHIDGFNTVITLEVALSGSPLLRCMDGCIRDLAGLRGTYRLIDKTTPAIMRIGEALAAADVREAVFYLDAPVSNSGRLKARILELLEPFPFSVRAEVIHNVDAVLETQDCVITGDAIILDRCRSWFALTRQILETGEGDYSFVDLHDIK